MTARGAGSPLSLRRRLTLGAGVLAFILLCGTWLLVNLGSRSYVESHARAVLTSVSRELLEEMEWSYTAEQDFVEMTEEIQEAAAQTSQRLVVLHVRDGQVVQRSHRDGPSWPGDGGRDWRLSVLPFHGDTLVAALYFGEAQDSLDRQSALLGWVCAGVLLLVTAGTWVLVGKVLSPIGLLSRQASQGGTRLVAPSDDAEIRELVNTVNDLLDSLTESAASQSRFYAAASHELRTPLQALSGHLDLALSRERSGLEYRRALDEARLQTERLSRLTRDLLTLNRLETETEPPAGPVDLADQVENAWSLLKERADDKSLQVECRLPETAELEAPLSYLEMVVRNLMENAVKYCPPDGSVLVEVTAAKLRIRNDSLPLTEDELNRLTQPFYRPDPSRHSQTGGNGLGLAIVASVAERQGWRMGLSQDASGFEVVVHF